jgi:hypothetical protein
MTRSGSNCANGRYVNAGSASGGAYADRTEGQMAVMFGWTDPKMPAREAHGVRFDRFQLIDSDFG